MAHLPFAGGLLLSLEISSVVLDEYSTIGMVSGIATDRDRLKVNDGKRRAVVCYRCRYEARPTS